MQTLKVSICSENYSLLPPIQMSDKCFISAERCRLVGAKRHPIKLVKGTVGNEFLKEIHSFYKDTARDKNVSSNADFFSR